VPVRFKAGMNGMMKDKPSILQVKYNSTDEYDKVPLGNLRSSFICCLRDKPNEQNGERRRRAIETHQFV